MKPHSQEFAWRVIDSYDDGAVLKLVSLFKELNDDHDAYLEVWAILPSTMRSNIKRILKEYGIPRPHDY